MKRMTFFMCVFLLISCKKDGGGNSDLAQVSDLKGLWTTSCQPTGGENTSVKSSLTISDTQEISDRILYGDVDCEKMRSIYRETREVKIRGTSQSGVFEIDEIIQTVEYKVLNHTDEELAELNSVAKPYGATDWQNDAFKDVTGKPFNDQDTAPKSKGHACYTILKVAGDDLYLPSHEGEQKDCTKPENRPTQISSIPLLRRQK